jgi:hypothetical protein
MEHPQTIEQKDSGIRRIFEGDVLEEFSHLGFIARWRGEEFRKLAELLDLKARREVMIILNSICNAAEKI